MDSLIYFEFIFRVKILRKPNKAGVSHADIIHQYLLALKKDVPFIKPSDPLFYRGNGPTPTVPSYFQNSHVGEGKLRLVAREMAQFLGLNNPENFKGHSFRHTSATLAAEKGAQVPQLMVS